MGKILSLQLCSVRPRIASSVDQQILAGDETGVLGAEEGAIGPEFGWAPVTPCRIGFGACVPELVEALAARSQHRIDVRALRAAVEDSRQQIVDGDVAGDGLAGKACDEAHESRACAVR